jgi:hypothetical protein
MRITSILHRAASSAAVRRSNNNNHIRKAQEHEKRSIKSLALSVHFKHPDFGMKDYEILSRASAFLLAVDPPPLGHDNHKSSSSDDMNDSSPYSHLAQNERERQMKIYKQHHRYTPAGQPGDNRELTELGWLEYAPREVRPTVHCVCSSHVLAPFLWKDYYPQDWLNKVRQEHW